MRQAKTGNHGMLGFDALFKSMANAKGTIDFSQMPALCLKTAKFGRPPKVDPKQKHRDI